MRADQKRLYKDVEFLTSIKPARNYRHPKALDDCISYLHKEMETARAEVSLQRWKADREVYTNVITQYRPEAARRLVVGAHYDVCGDQPGADDNASAVAGLLELVRLIFREQPSLDYGIDFVAYCLEEPPFFATQAMGSYVHARSLHENKVDVIGMICLEMIGYFSDEPNSQAFPSPELGLIYPHTANFIIVVGIERFRDFNEQVHRLMAKDSGIDVQVIHFPSAEGLAGLSDQRNYWPFGFPALMINDTSFIRNPHYHSRTDTIETLDFPKMTEVVNSAYRALTGLG